MVRLFHGPHPLHILIYDYFTVPTVLHSQPSARAVSRYVFYHLVPYTDLGSQGYFSIKRCSCYTPRFNEVERGVYWYHLVRLSVCLSVCGQNCVRSVSSTILIRSISYLHILSSNFRRCVACNARFKIQKFEILAIFLNL